MTETPIWRRDEIQSPCINICVIHPETRLCTGCLRSIVCVQWITSAGTFCAGLEPTKMPM